MRFIILILLLVMGVGISYSQAPVVDSIKYQDSTNIHNTPQMKGIFYGIIYMKNRGDKVDTICIQKYTQMGTLVEAGVVNLDSSGNVSWRILLPPDGKYHTYGINHIYPGGLVIRFTNVVASAIRRNDYEINYYQK